MNEQKYQPTEGDIYLQAMLSFRMNVYRYNGQDWQQIATLRDEDAEALVAPMQFLWESKGHRRYYRPTGE